MGDAPALGDVELEALCQQGGLLPGDGVAPGAEFRELAAVLIKGQVAVHHGGYTKGPQGAKPRAVFLLYVLCKGPVGALYAGDGVLQAVGPYAVCQLVLPVEGPAGNRAVVGADEHGLYAGGAQLYAQGGLTGVYGFCDLSCGHIMSS